MANEILERNCLEAELLLGYKYYQSEAALAEDCKKKTKALQSARGYLDAVKAEYPNQQHADLNSDAYFEKNYAHEKEAYLLDYQAEENRQKEQRQRNLQAAMEKEKAEAKEFNKKQRIIGSVLLVVGLLLVALTIMMSIKGCEGAKTPADASPLASIAVFVGIGAAAVLGGAFSAFAKEFPAADAQPNEISGNITIKFPTFREWLIKKNGLSYFKQNYPAKSEAQTQREHQAEQAFQTATADLQAAQLRERTLKDKGVQLQTLLTVIPPYYFQNDAITKMLFFYVNKRADNIRDLINLYETTVFQEAVIKSLQSISISVDRLTETVRGSFNRLGLQLGVINESIQENTATQRISHEKLSQIKDENTKHYMAMVNAIEEIECISNTYVSTNVTSDIEVNINA